MQPIMRGAALAICLLPFFLPWDQASAQSHAGVHPAAAGASAALALKSTKLASKSNTVVLSTSPTLAFDPLTIDCPNNAVSCTLRIEVSAGFAKLTSSAQMQFLVDGTQTGIIPAGTVLVRASNDNGLFTETFTVWSPSLAPGSHEVRVRLPLGVLPSGGEQGVVTMRTLTVQMFTP